jgi:hypothetical protein
VRRVGGWLMLLLGLPLIGSGQPLLTSDPRPKLMFVGAGVVVMAVGSLRLARRQDKGV